jgi:hypothetical protein
VHNENDGDDHDDDNESMGNENSIPWEIIFGATAAAISHRMNKLLEEEEVCHALVNEEGIISTDNGKACHTEGKYTHRGLSDDEKVNAINTMSALCAVEKTILAQAIEIVDMTSRIVAGEQVGN